MPRDDDGVVENLPQPVLTHPRRISLDLRNHLRRLIIESQLAPGQVLKQAQLARVFGVSRTPMREAFRMLQEEGLIEAETNQRATVRHLDVNEVDQLYSARILLESFGARLTAGRISTAEVTDAHARLEAMDRARDAEDMDAWGEAHRGFHRICVARADEPLTRVIDSYSERAERYRRLDQVWHPQSFEIAHGEHESILAAIVDGDRDASGARMAQHLARTAKAVLRDIAPDFEAVATDEAVNLCRTTLHDLAAGPTSSAVRSRRAR